MRILPFALAGLLAGSAAIGLAETDVASRLDAGLWEVTSTVTGGGGPAQPPVVARRCLTSEEAAKGVEAMLLGGQPGCTATRSTMAAGKLDAQLQCGAGSDKAMTVAVKASFAPKSYEAVSDIAMASGGSAMHVDVTGKWVGACSS